MSAVERFAGSWRRVLLAGWAMFVVSFVLPATAVPPLGPRLPPPPPPQVTEAPDDEPVESADTGEPDEPAERPVIRGCEDAFVAVAMVGAMYSVEDIVAVLSGLSNLLVLLTFLKLRGVRPPESRWLIRLVAGAAVLNLYWALSALFDGPHFWQYGTDHLRVGYWVWAASFICVAVALYLRARESARST